MISDTTSQLQVCESLIQEHRQMEAMLTQLEHGLGCLTSPEPELVEAIRKIMDQIIPEMNTHFACEEQVLFPAVTPYHPMVLMEVEHEELMALRQEVLDILGQSAINVAEISKLQTIGTRFISDMLDHIGREDGGVFPTCERALSPTEKQAVIDGMAELRAKAKRQPTPAIQRPEHSFEAQQIDLTTPAQRAVFSERLVDADGLEVKHLVIQAGKSIPEHWAPKQGTLICLQGQGLFQADNRKIPLVPGTTIIMSPQLRHSVQADTDCHLLLILH